MKKYLALLLAGLMLTGALLTACDSNSSSKDDDDDKEKTTTAESDGGSGGSGVIQNPSSGNKTESSKNDDDDGKADVGKGTKTFTVEGLTLTLSDEFKETEPGVYELNDDVGVMVNDAGVSTDLITIDELAEATLEILGLSDTTLNHDYGMTYAECEVDGYYDLICFYEGSDTIWMVQFLCASNLSSEYKSDFMEYAKSVVVN